MSRVNILLLKLQINCQLSVAGPGFPRGRQLPREVHQTIVLQIFCWKLHENERIWADKRGMRSRPGGPPPLHTGYLSSRVYNIRSSTFMVLIFNTIIKQFCKFFDYIDLHVFPPGTDMIQMKNNPAMETVFDKLEEITPLEKLEEKRKWRDEGIARLSHMRSKMNEETGS